MQERHNFYRDIHKAIRRMMMNLLVAGGRTDFMDVKAARAYADEVREAFAGLTDHAEHENAFVGPLVVEHAPHLAQLVGPAHDDQEGAIRALVQQLGAIAPGTAGSAARGHAFVVRLSSFFGELLTHMAEEEELIMPALWRAMTDEELMNVHHRLLATIPPEKMVVVLSVMLPALNDPERVELVTGIRTSAPEPVFAMVMGVARAVLADGDLAVLEAAIASHAAA